MLIQEIHNFSRCCHFSTLNNYQYQYQ